MKIIDLYNMVANGEQPNKFKYKDRWFAYSVDDKEFRTLKQEVYNGDYPEYIYLSELIDLSNLNDEIEIIGEPKKIEKIIINSMGNIERYDYYGRTTVLVSVSEEIKYIAEKLNKIIDYINSKEDK